MEKYVLIGDSGHAKVIEDCIVSNGNQVIAKLDDKYTDTFKEGPYLKGPISNVYNLLADGIKVVISIGNNEIRRKIVQKLNLEHRYYGIVIHKSAIISTTSTFGIGTVIMPNVVVNANATIGAHVILNTGSIIEHDDVIEDFVHVSPGCVLTGNVTVGEGTQIGAKSVVIPSVTIGRWSMIGAGSSVVRNIGDHVTAVGVPAKVIRKKD